MPEIFWVFAKCQKKSKFPFHWHSSYGDRLILNSMIIYYYMCKRTNEQMNETICKQFIIITMNFSVFFFSRCVKKTFHISYTKDIERFESTKNRWNVCQRCLLFLFKISTPINTFPYIHLSIGFWALFAVFW